MADLRVCADCQRDDLSATEQLDHLAQMLEHEGVLRAMLMVHGRHPPDRALRRFYDVGGVLHLTTDDAERLAATGSLQDGR